MKRTMYAGAGVLAIGLWLGVTTTAQSQSQGKDPNLSTDKGKETTAAAVALLNQAATLVSYARENESPLAMVTAVQMLRRVRADESGKRLERGDSGDVTEAAPAPQGTAGDAEGKKGDTPAPTLDPQALLTEAKAWAEGDQALLAVIDAEMARKVPQSGGTLGSTVNPVYQPGRLPARTYVNWIVTMRGGELARIAVVGNGASDLDLHVYDENGNLIARDVDYTDRCVVQWTPRWTGKFRVRISNLGRVANSYVLLSN